MIYDENSISHFWWKNGLLSLDGELIRDVVRQNVGYAKYGCYCSGYVLVGAEDIISVGIVLRGEEIGKGR